MLFSSSSYPDYRRVEVSLQDRSYGVVVGGGAVETLLQALPDDVRARLGARRVHIVTDDHVAPLYATAFRDTLSPHVLSANLIVVPAGEGSKSFATYQNVMDQMLVAGVDRQTLVIAFGGGVIGDLAGFAAATLLRGIDFIQIPTTLLAQVDSSVGGKTGINTLVGKNLVGAFHQPRLVLCDTAMLTTLPPREFAAGMAEIIKAALLADTHFFDWLEIQADAVIARDHAAIDAMVARAIEIKASVVARDEFEENGLRATLNLGHTFGHAVETFAGYDGRVLHGEAVGLGLVQAAMLSAALGLITAGDVNRIRALVKKFGLPVVYGDFAGLGAVDAGTLIANMYKDKKAAHGALSFVVLDRIGQARLQHNIDPAIVTAILADTK